jgi:hypothetical protein
VAYFEALDTAHACLQLTAETIRSLELCPQRLAEAAAGRLGQLLVAQIAGAQLDRPQGADRAVGLPPLEHEGLQRVDRHEHGCEQRRGAAEEEER